jgi:trimethylamine---corrinoid protein Co-methyltransferase
LAGANLIYGAGMTESGVTFDYAQYVLDNDLAKMIKHEVRGVPVDDETLGLRTSTPSGSFGDFLSLESTLKHMREQSQPRFLDRRVREDWEASGARAPTRPPRRPRSRSSKSTTRRRSTATWPTRSTPW